MEQNFNKRKKEFNSIHLFRLQKNIKKEKKGKH